MYPSLYKSLLDLLDYYINHQKKVVTRRTEFDLERAEKREHILEGLIIAVADIDMIVKIIRGSSDAREARLNLMKKYRFTGVQAQAILDMRLARLTSLEIVSLKEEYEERFGPLCINSESMNESYSWVNNWPWEVENV